VDARRCISYLTIEHEGLVDRELHAGMGDWLFGCDVCQDVCPFNAVSHPGVPRRVHPLYREREGLVGGRLRLLDVLRWTPEDRRVALTVSAGKRASLDMLRRNAVIAAGNGGEIGEGSELGGELRRVAAEDASPVVRDTAIQVLGT
jgi:epoxyqueuosine reductase